jgi:hypothetical protein
MYGVRDAQGNLWTQVQVGVWNYGPADHVVEPGFPDHHLRIIQQHYADDGVRWYLIFDTSLRERFSDYKWRRADELESRSRLEKRPNPGDVEAILKRAGACRYILYSLLARTDCESLQRWIHTGDEGDRWSPQVWIGAGAVVGSLALILAQPKPKRRRGR